MSSKSTRRRATQSLCLFALCGAIGCGAGSDNGGADSTSATGRLRVALLTPGPISDRSWNGGAYDGLMAIRDSLGAQVSHVQTKTPAEFEENFRQYGAQGYDLVIGHGFEFQDAAVRVGPEFPKTIYVTTSGNTVRANVAGIQFAFEEASYLAGILAAGMTKTANIGAIGGTELPPVKRSFEAYTAGARSVNPGINVVVSYVGNWDDLSAGKEQALAQIGRRTDVIFQNADAAGLGVFQAAKEAGSAYVIGANADQNAVAPEVTLGSVVIDLRHAFLLVAREVRSGRFQPRVVSLGVRDDVVRLVLNPVLKSRIPAPVRATIDSVQRRLDDGSIRLTDSTGAFVAP
ncbi:MAG: basic rane lipoprotein [Geminicoccaceae bacterium]|nr:basic rane lipoprotein [Geminicoccaceae bacterium]